MSFPLNPKHMQKKPGFQDISKDLPGFESTEDCKKESEIRQKDLRNSTDPTHHELAKKLAGCRKNHRCESPACPHCSRIHRGGFYHAVMKLSNKYLKETS